MIYEMLNRLLPIVAQQGYVSIHLIESLRVLPTEPTPNLIVSKITPWMN